MNKLTGKNIQTKSFHKVAFTYDSLESISDLTKAFNTTVPKIVGEELTLHFGKVKINRGNTAIFTPDGKFETVVTPEVLAQYYEPLSKLASDKLSLKESDKNFLPETKVPEAKTSKEPSKGSKK